MELKIFVSKITNAVSQCMGHISSPLLMEQETKHIQLMAHVTECYFLQDVKTYTICCYIYYTNLKQRIG